MDETDDGENDDGENDDDDDGDGDNGDDDDGDDDVNDDDDEMVMIMIIKCSTADRILKRDYNICGYKIFFKSKYGYRNTVKTS